MENAPKVWTKEAIDFGARRDYAVHDLFVAAVNKAEEMWPNQDSDEDDLMRNHIVEQQVVELTVRRCVALLRENNMNIEDLLDKFGLVDE